MSLHRTILSIAALTLFSSLALAGSEATPKEKTIKLLEGMNCTIDIPHNSVRDLRITDEYVRSDGLVALNINDSSTKIIVSLNQLDDKRIEYGLGISEFIVTSFSKTMTYIRSSDAAEIELARIAENRDSTNSVLRCRNE